MSTHLATAQMAAVMDLLDRAVCLHGSPIGEDARARIFAAIDNPRQMSWHNAYTVLISPPMTTLWQAVVKHTDYAVYSKPEGLWPVVPTRKQLVDALMGELGGSR